MQTNEDYKLLLSPLFSAMTKITDNLFLTGIGGMTRENLKKNHIDFIVNITTEAPVWDGLDSIRLPLEDESSANILNHFDMAVERIHEAITRRNAHVLVHCVAGVSRSATIVIAYLMKYRRMDLHTAFNYCYNLRPVIRPNNGFMEQLIHYEQQLFGKTSVRMQEADVDGVIVSVPHFFVEEHPRLVLLEVLRVRDQAHLQARVSPQTQHQHQQQQQQRTPRDGPTTVSSQTTITPLSAHSQPPGPLGGKSQLSSQSSSHLSSHSSTLASSQAHSLLSAIKSQLAPARSTKSEVKNKHSKRNLP